MKACISFEQDYYRAWTGPLWLLWSPSNEAWFRQQKNLSGGSALIYSSPEETPTEALLRTLWNIEDHHPLVCSTDVYGFDLTTSLRQALQDNDFEIVASSLKDQRLQIRHISPGT